MTILENPRTHPMQPKQQRALELILDGHSGMAKTPN